MDSSAFPKLKIWTPANTVIVPENLCFSTYEKAAIQKLAKMPPKTASLIRKKIKQVAKSPYSPNNNIANLVSQDQVYRLRIGDWRVIYKIDNGELKILILEIGQRGDIYKK